MAASSSTGASGQVKMGEFFYGWDLLFRTVDKEINKKSDLLITLTHFLLTKHYNFRCVGIGDDKTISADEVATELMPDNWNDDDTKYALRYIHGGKLFLLLGHITEDTLVVNLLDIDTKTVSNIALEPNTMVAATKGNINALFPKSSEIINRLRKELLEPVFSGVTREVTTQTSSAQPERSEPLRNDPLRIDPLRIGEPRRPGSFGPTAPIGYDPHPFGFPEIGRGDLDPLARGGHGNLFPFPSQPNFQGSGGQPRFDPFAPPDGNIRPNPNPDHMRPPHWGGDYYM